MRIINIATDYCSSQYSSIDEWLAKINAVRCDRGSNYGNPFVMKNKSLEERLRVCNLFELYANWRIKIEPDWLLPLRGRNLACWCHPKSCHCETLLKLANPSL